MVWDWKVSAVGRPGGAAAARWRTDWKRWLFHRTSLPGVQRVLTIFDNMLLTVMEQMVYLQISHKDWDVISSRKTLNLGVFSSLPFPYFLPLPCTRLFVFFSLPTCANHQAGQFWPTSIMRSDASFPMPGVCAEFFQVIGDIYLWKIPQKPALSLFHLSMDFMMIGNLTSSSLLDGWKTPWGQGSGLFCVPCTPQSIAALNILYCILMFWHLGPYWPSEDGSSQD